MRRIAVVTTSRADFGIYRPILRRMAADARIDLQLVAAGSHLLPSMGNTIDEVTAEMPVIATLDVLEQPMTPVGVARSMARMLVAFGETLDSLGSELVVVLGDRFEMHAAALAALPLQVPVAHIHGGEVTQGAFDDSLRHSMTKLSHLHFVATAGAAARVAQLGEEPWRITVSGAPSLDDLRERAVRGVADLARLATTFDPAPVVVAYHPATMESGAIEEKLDELLAALDDVDRPVLLTAPNADPGGDVVLRRLTAYAGSRADATLVPSFGVDAFAALLARAAVLVGNSSAGIIEAGAFGLPVVNVGARQTGRERGPNVLDVANDRHAIAEAIAEATSPAFRAGLVGARDPYDAGGAAPLIVERLATEPLGIDLLQKRFIDLP